MILFKWQCDIFDRREIVMQILEVYEVLWARCNEAVATPAFNCQAMTGCIVGYLTLQSNIEPYFL